MATSGETSKNLVEDLAILPGPNKQRGETRKTKSPKPSQPEVERVPPDAKKRRITWKTESPKPSQQEEWVQSRRIIWKTESPKPPQQEEWVQSDVTKLPKTVSNLIENVLPYIKEVEESHFYHQFLFQMETPEIVESFHKLLGNESRMQMVIYGIGSIESNERARFQLGLALLMKRQFSWIGGIEVFDPVITVTDSKVLEALGCCVLSVNEECRRQALTPTMFFMPFCDENLYCNLLQANWRIDMLKRIVILGNTFSVLKEKWRLLSKVRRGIVKSDNAAPSELMNKIFRERQYMAAAIEFVKEIPISGYSGHLGSSLSDFSWHFLDPDSESQLQLPQSIDL